MILMSTPPTVMVNLMEPSARACSVIWWPFLRGLDAGPLHGVDLEKAIEAEPWSPQAPVEVIEVNLPCSRVDDGGIGPVWQPDDQAADLAAEELSGAVDRRRQLKAATCGSADCRVVANLGLDCHRCGKWGPPRCGVSVGMPPRRGGGQCRNRRQGHCPGWVRRPRHVRRLGSPPDARLFGTDI